jgi:glycosyltransferase involved in cell wall biosynthesis
LRLALLGAFPFPSPQGSQAYFAAQARALRAAGAPVTLVCYGSGAGGVELAGIEIVRAPRAFAPRGARSGPSAAKPLADAALAATLLAAHRRRRFDAVLAHNAEAAAAGLAVRPLLRCPVIYVAHTLLGRELESYAPAPLAAALRALGTRLDALLARRADAVVSLSRSAERALGAAAPGRVARIPPGLAPAAPPDPAVVTTACRRHGLAPGGFALYAGNLDGYQELAMLAAAAARVELPVVVATHAATSAPTPLRTVRVGDADAARRLAFGAALALLPRRAPGGFPVKLLNYMEAGCAILARASVADTLEHGRSAWLLADGAGPEDWAKAIAGLAADRAKAAGLGAEARRTLAREHDPAALAKRTLDFVAGRVRPRR